MGAESSSSPPLRDKMMRSSDIIAKDGINYDPKKKQYCSIPEASRPCYALSGLQRLLKTFRKADQQEEPKIVGLSIVIQNSWSYSCWKDQLKSVSVSGHTMGSPAKIASSCKTSPQIVSKSSLAAQCKDRETNGGSEHRSSVLLFPPTVVYSNVVASTPLPAIDFLDSCYLCKRSLGPGLDIYMYRGDKAFCSVECRSKQIAMDEQREKSSSAALKPSVTTTAPRDRLSAKNRTHIAHGRELTTAA